MNSFNQESKEISQIGRIKDFVWNFLRNHSNNGIGF
jgi:hypothetical protein